MGTFDQQQQHPITPPPELVEQWYRDSPEDDEQCYIATQAARWGADQELEACVEHLKRIWSPSDTIDSLCTARRPKPPSLAEQALAALNEIEDRYAGPSTQEILVRRALERLQELESNG